MDKSTSSFLFLSSSVIPPGGTFRYKLSVPQPDKEVVDSGSSTMEGQRRPFTNNTVYASLMAPEEYLNSFSRFLGYMNSVCIRGR